MPTLISDDIGTRAKAFLTKEARDAGFDTVGVADVDGFGDGPGGRLDEFLRQGRHGEMDWLEETAGRRRHPRALWNEVRSAVVVGFNYGPSRNPLDDLQKRDCGVISVYARGRDYHEVMKGRLKTLAQRFVSRFGGDIKVFVDTAPVMEKPLAELAGIGWQGKHTNLVSREFGSWLFLGALFTTVRLPADKAHEDRCGSCRRCLDVCPTNAFPVPYQLDARRCIAYLTIEAKGMVPQEFRKAMGNRIFGCDDCLAVCPWNSFASASARLRDGVDVPNDPAPLAELATLSDEGFRQRYRKTPVKRLGRERFVRNVMIAVGNAGRKEDGRLIEASTADEAPQVRAAAVWAAREVLPPARFQALAARRRGAEHHAGVRAEWSA